MYVSGGGTLSKSKGFTLIELLAVIVILAIIALIATPIVLNIIKDSKENAQLRSAEMYIKGLENSIATSTLKNKKLSNGNYDILEDGNICIEYNGNECKDKLKVEVNGETPQGGLVTLEKSKIVAYELIYKNRIIVKEIDGKIESKENIYTSVKDNNPGIICGEGTIEDLNQTTCYIKSIEDLVELSTLVNKYNTFEGKTVELVYNLDFNNKESYANKTVDRTLITGKGFESIGNSYYIKFKGIFEGNNKTIRGLYINTPDLAYRGLFGNIEFATIQNLSMENANVIANSGSGILVGTSTNGTIQNINLNNTNLITQGRSIGSLVGNNKDGTIKNIKATNISVVGDYFEVGGLIGFHKNGTIENVVLDNIKLKNENRGASGLVGANESGIIKDIKISNVNIEASGGGGLAGSNLTDSIVQNVDIQNVEIKSSGDYAGGLIGSNTGKLVENIILNNISITSNKNNAAGFAGVNNTGTIKKVLGKNIKVHSKNDNTGGLVGQNFSGIIEQIKLTNVSVEGNSFVGGLAGSNISGTIKNSILQANVKGGISVGLIVGQNNTGVINTVVVEGNVDGIYHNIGGLFGNIVGTSDAVADISGVYLSGNLNYPKHTRNNRTIGNYGTYVPVMNTLASSTVTINGNTIESTDITSKDGKTLTDMGKASQSEYEAIGFEFESTEENECYWYFDKNNKLDLMIK